MKKSRKILWISLFFLLIFAVIFAVASRKIIRTRDGAADLLLHELQLADDEAAVACVGEFEANNRVLLWFTVQTQDRTLYQAVDCKPLALGGYLIMDVRKPMIYAQDIVHVVWMAKDVFLINNSECRVIAVDSGTSGDAVSRIELSPDDLPYVFPDGVSGSGKLDFLDAEGNPVR